MSVGANGLNILDFMARYETIEIMEEKELCIHDLILQLSFRKIYCCF
jgi:hypothetical protein